MTIERMDHMGVVVDDLDAAVAFFLELGMEREGEATVEGAWVDQLLGLDGVQADMVVVRTPDGHGRVELSTFRSPRTGATAPSAPANVPGIPRIAFRVEGLTDLVERLRPHGGELVGEIAEFDGGNRYCYVRGPAGVILGLFEEVR